jgi:hypothetical protein
LEASEVEISDLGLAAQRMWDLDLDKLAEGQDYQINIQDGKWFSF